MALRNVIVHPDGRLRAKANPVTVFDDDLGTLIDDLAETMADAKAIGLSATQVGDRRAVLVIDPDGTGTARAFVNPVIGDTSRPGFVQESCLSVPGVVGNVIRATKVSVSAVDRNGESFDAELDGMHAVSLQHEADHLNGILFIDRFSLFGRWRQRMRDWRNSA